MKSNNLSEIIRPVIFGVNDALVSEIALVAGLSGALLSTNIIILAGVTEALTGAISMSFGTYISSKSQLESYEGEIKKEKESFTQSRIKKEIEKIYRHKGFKGRELKRIVSTICSNKKRCFKELIENDLGLVRKRFNRPKREAIAIGVSYAISSMFPLIPFFVISYMNIMSQLSALFVAMAITAMVLFFTGAYKTRFTNKKWFRSGAEMVLIGLLASFLGYLIGYVIPS